MARDYSCLMLGYNIPMVKEIQDKIDENHLYLGEEDEEFKYGLETDTHVTLLYGIHKNIKFNDFKHLLIPLENFKIILVNISLFNCEKYDVLKIDVKSPKLNEINSTLTKNIEYTNEYPDYKPHITIAYLKKGCGEEYTKKMMDKIVEATPTSYLYGTFDENGKNKEEKYNNDDL